MCIVVKKYIDYIYQELGEELAAKVLSIPPGLRLLRNGSKNLFDHPHVKLWHRFLVNHFDPGLCGRRYAIVMPCSSVKPYRASPTHQIVEAVLSRYKVLDSVQVYILSEPMVLVPRELDIYYPFANYDYPTHELFPKYREILVELLSLVLPKLKYHRKIVAVLPKHHMNILQESLARSSVDLDIIFVEYGKKAFHSVKVAAESIAKYVNHDGREL